MDDTGIFDIPNTSLIFWEIITFAILLFLLYRYVYPPIRDQILDRQSEIEEAIDEAQKTRSEARELLAEYRRQIDEARGEARPDPRRGPQAGRGPARADQARGARGGRPHHPARPRGDRARARRRPARRAPRGRGHGLSWPPSASSSSELDRDEHEPSDLRGPRQPRGRGVAGSVSGDAAGPLERRLDLRRGPLRGRARARRARGRPGGAAGVRRTPSTRARSCRLFFYGGQVPEREKRRAIDALTEGMSLSTRNFLKVLLGQRAGGDRRRGDRCATRSSSRSTLAGSRSRSRPRSSCRRTRWSASRSGSASVLEGREVILETRVDANVLGGAIFRFGGRMVDGSVRGQLASLRDEMLERSVGLVGRLRPEEISSILKGAITDYENRVRSEEVGQVLEVGDGIARVHGLHERDVPGDGRVRGRPGREDHRSRAQPRGRQRRRHRRRRRYPHPGGQHRQAHGAPGERAGRRGRARAGSSTPSAARWTARARSSPRRTCPWRSWRPASSSASPSSSRCRRASRR